MAEPSGLAAAVLNLATLAGKLCAMISAVGSATIISLYNPTRDFEQLHTVLECLESGSAARWGRGTWGEIGPLQRLDESEAIKQMVSRTEIVYRCQ